MTYRCKEIQSMIERYESTSDAQELINSLQRHIDTYGGIYEAAGISADDFAEYGYDTEKVTDEILETVARKADTGECIMYAIEYWADRFGIPKKEEVLN
jgi:hypothetical protein